MVCSCYEQATDVQHMTTGEDTMGKSVVIPLHGDNIHLQHLFHPEALAPLVDQPQQDVSWPHSLPSTGRLLGQHRGWDLDVITVGGNMVRAKAVS